MVQAQTPMDVLRGSAAMTDAFQEAIRAIYATSKPSVALWAYHTSIGDNETCSRSPKD